MSIHRSWTAQSLSSKFMSLSSIATFFLFLYSLSCFLFLPFCLPFSRFPFPTVESKKLFNERNLMCFCKWIEPISGDGSRWVYFGKGRLIFLEAVWLLRRHGVTIVAVRKRKSWFAFWIIAMDYSLSGLKTPCSLLHLPSHNTGWVSFAAAYR